MSTEHEHLMGLAEAVADEQQIDWSPGDLASGTASRLREIEAVAAAFRRTTRPERRMMFQWGHLAVVERLGEGSYGEVFRAFDPVLEREVALKLRRPGPTVPEGGGQRFVDEARRLARVRHPNVLDVYGADLHDGRVGVWTELVEGRTLAEQLAAEGPLGSREAASVGLDLCGALAAVHAAGLVHGDLKAANVIRERGGRIVLGDFGSSTEVADGLPASASPATMAPELLHGGSAAPSADLYSLGVLLYHLVSGRYPVEADSVESLLAAVAAGAWTPLRDLRPDLPAGFIAVVERALDPDPEDRFASVGVMERALRALVEESPASTPEASASVTDPVRHRLRRALLPVQLAAVAVAAIALVLLVRAVMDSPPPVQVAPTTVPTAALDVEPPAGVGRAASEVGPPAQLRAEADRSAPETTRAAPAPLVVQATLFRTRDGDTDAIVDGGSVAPGDRLHLRFESPEPVHVHLVNGDAVGAVFLLFPLAGADLGNPLPAGVHRLPGRVNGVSQDWRVTSAGGRETLLLVASRQPLPELENELARFRAAGRAETVRGIGGLASVSEPPAGAGALTALERVARSQARADADLWVQRIELRNAAP